MRIACVLDFNAGVALLLQREPRLAGNDRELLEGPETPPFFARLLRHAQVVAEEISLGGPDAVEKAFTTRAEWTFRISTSYGLRSNTLSTKEPPQNTTKALLSVLSPCGRI